MLDMLDRYTMLTSCACCPGQVHSGFQAIEIPQEDLCCEACGKAIFRAPGATGRL
jgi:hypothetical protein